jgi:hypothetical protein
MKSVKKIAYTTLFIIGGIASLLGALGLLLGFPLVIVAISIVLGLIIACIAYIPLMRLLIR